MHARTHTYTHTHTHIAKAYLQSEREAKQSGEVAGGRVGAAVCEIEALKSRKDSAKTWGEMAK